MLSWQKLSGTVIVLLTTDFKNNETKKTAAAAAVFLCVSFTGFSIPDNSIGEVNKFVFNRGF